MADVTIVPLSEENVQLFSQTAAKILPEAWSFETYKKQLSNPDDISFLALCNGEAAGFISVWCVCGEAEINNIGVLEKFRRMGIAKALFDSAYNAAKAEKWYLEVRESNLTGLTYYAGKSAKKGNMNVPRCRCGSGEKLGGGCGDR